MLFSLIPFDWKFSMAVWNFTEEALQLKFRNELMAMLSILLLS